MGKMAGHHYIWLIDKPIFKCEYKSNSAAKINDKYTALLLILRIQM